MATVNIANNNWQTWRETSTIKITASSTYVHFGMGDDLTDEMAEAKACVEIDVSKYKTIIFTYDNKFKDGISSLEFGIYDNMIPGDSSGNIVISSGDWKKSGSITVNVSDLTGIKYVGFNFYGNTYRLDEEVGWTVQQSLTITSLVAVEKSYTLTYDANGGSGGPGLIKDVTSTSISNIIPNRNSYDFLGWSTSLSATYASYVSGDSISLTSDTTLYAVWRKFYTVTYNANGGSNAPSLGKKIDGQSLIIDSTSPTPPTDTYVTYTVTFNTNGEFCDEDATTVTHVITYEFTHWNTKSDGSGISYQPGELYTNNGDITLYAQYTPLTTYDSIALPIPFRDNYDFLGWSTNKHDTSGITGEYTPTGDITLYATWKCRGHVYICDNAGEYSPYKVLIYDGFGWNQYVPYIYTESGWEVYSG